MKRLTAGRICLARFRRRSRDILPKLKKITPKAIAASQLLKTFWLPVATLVLVVGAIWAWSSIDDPAELSSFGSYASGIAAALTLFWLAVGQRDQMAELAMQREELALQRLAAEQQARELHNSARIGIMTQVKSLVDDALLVLNESNVVSSEADLSTAYMKGMLFWKDIEHSTNSAKVIESYGEWLKVESTCKRYLGCISTAMRLHQEFNHPNNPIPADKEPFEVVYIYQPWMKNAPFLSSHIGIAAFLANQVLMLQPGAKRMLLASMVAHAKQIGLEFLKEGTLEEMRDEVLLHSATLPAICTPWPETTIRP